MAIQFVRVDVSEVKKIAAKFDLECCGALCRCARDFIDIPIDWDMGVDKMPIYLKTPFMLAAVEFAAHMVKQTTERLESIEKQFSRNAEKIIRGMYAWYNPKRYIALAEAWLMAKCLNDFIKSNKGLVGYVHDLRHGDEWLDGLFKEAEKLRNQMDEQEAKRSRVQLTCEASIEEHIPSAKKKAEQAEAKAAKPSEKRPKAQAAKKKSSAPKASAKTAENKTVKCKKSEPVNKQTEATKKGKGGKSGAKSK